MICHGLMVITFLIVCTIFILILKKQPIKVLYVYALYKMFIVDELTVLKSFTTVRSGLVQDELQVSQL